MSKKVTKQFKKAFTVLTFFNEFVHIGAQCHLFPSKPKI